MKMKMIIKIRFIKFLYLQAKKKNLGLSLIMFFFCGLFIWITQKKMSITFLFIPFIFNIISHFFQFFSFRFTNYYVCCFNESNQICIHLKIDDKHWSSCEKNCKNWMLVKYISHIILSKFISFFQFRNLVFISLDRVFLLQH